MSALALVACFIPWDARTFLNIPVRYFIAVGCIWGGICGLAPYYIRNRIGQRIVIDTEAQTVTIHQRDTSNVASRVLSNPASILSAEPPTMPARSIRFEDVLAVQIAGDGPFQANLVYRDGETIVRHNLVSHGAKSFAESIADAYCEAGGFKLLDHS